MLVAASQNLVDRATWYTAFVYPSFMVPGYSAGSHIVPGYSAGSHIVPLDQFTNFHETL